MEGFHLTERKFVIFDYFFDSMPHEKLLTRKEIVVTEAYIDDFQTSFYITSIQKL